MLPLSAINVKSVPTFKGRRKKTCYLGQAPTSCNPFDTSPGLRDIDRILNVVWSIKNMGISANAQYDKRHGKWSFTFLFYEIWVFIILNNKWYNIRYESLLFKIINGTIRDIVVYYLKL